MTLQELKEMLVAEYHHDRGMMDGIAKVIRTIEQNQENAAEIERTQEKQRWFGEEGEVAEE